MPIPLKARRSFTYAGHDLRAGAEFNAITGADAKLLIAIGHAEARTGQYMTRVMVAAKPDLDQMNIEDLRVLASRLGIRVHHRAGPDKLRSAIRSAKG